MHASPDGTIKYTFALSGGLAVETVYIPEKERHTLCVSTQAGCRMGCRFCHTGQMRLQAQLTTEQILAQIAHVPEAPKLTHLVFMGMGEPFDNPSALFPALRQLIDPRQYAFAPRRISVSTAGLLPGIITYLRDFSCPLSISLHSPFPQERAQLMPIENKWPIASIMETIRQTPRSKHRRIFCEYLMFQNLNHTPDHAQALAELLRGIPARINLMRPHPIPGANFRPPGDAEILQFRDELNHLGLIATIRRTRGLEIEAACGMLATKPQVSNGSPGA
ncbi:MAG: 23S rRNA (adenine(2503)-C(2))-methyltransferase RlmN [Kiritimatiellia bacterium]